MANYNDGTTRHVDSTIYRWDGTEYAPIQEIPTIGGWNWKSFTIGGTPYLAVANYYDGSTTSLDSNIYRWDGSQFVEFQSIPTVGGFEWEEFEIDGTPFLAIANFQSASSFDVDSTIYKWDGAAFTPLVSIPTHGAYDWEHFTIGSDHFLMLANNRTGSQFAVDSILYRFDGTQLTEHQHIPTFGASSSSHFTIDGEHYLALTNHRTSSTNFDADSVIMRWDGSQFVEIQAIPTSGAMRSEYFEWNGEPYLAMTSYRDNAGYQVDSALYRWNGNQFVQSANYPSTGAGDSTFFTIDGTPYVAVASFYDGSTYNLNSTLYRLDETFPPLAEASAEPLSGTAPFTVNLDASSSSDPDGGTITGYQWLTSDAQSATGVTASFTFTQPGSYSIQLTVTDDEGQTASTTIDIQVNAVDTSNCEGRASYSAVTGELHLPLMEVATVPLLGGVGRPAGETTVPAAATLRIIPGTTLFEIQSVLSATPDNDPAVTPCHARYTIDGVLDVPRVDVPIVTAIGGLTVTTGVDTYHATLEQLPMSDLFQLTAIELFP